MKKKILSILLLFCSLSFAKPNIKIKTKTLDVLVKTKTETINLEINNGYGLNVNKGIDENIPAQIAIFTGITAVNITICFCLGILFLSIGD